MQQFSVPKLSESKYQAGFGEIILGQNPQTFMIPIYSTTVLYDNAMYKNRSYIQTLLHKVIVFESLYAELWGK